MKGVKVSPILGMGTGFQVGRYCLVGAVNTLIDVGILNVLLWRFPTSSVQTLVVYKSLAYTGGAASSFFLNKYWTFRRKHRPTGQEVGRFVIGMVLELLSSNGLLWLIAGALHPLIANTLGWENASNLLAVVANAALSYLLMRFWIFATARDFASRQSRERKPLNRRERNVS
jgi:putative flippase GtrA